MGNKEIKKPLNNTSSSINAQTEKKEDWEIMNFQASSLIRLDSNVYISELKNNPDEIYRTIKFLGEGSFAAVHKVQHLLTNEIRAMKIIQKTSESSETEDEEILNEINILKKMDHPNIIKIFEFYSCPQTYQIVTEICEGGELFNQIVEHAPFSEMQAAYIMYQLFSAINYCHKMKIIHRDLKPENILIEKIEEDDFFKIKVSDFGTSKIFEKGKIEQKIVGSSYYIAPEVLQKEYTEKCDLWSCGVILYILLSGSPPFTGDSEREIIKSVKGCKYDLTGAPFNKLSIEVKNLLTSLLQKDVLKRIDAESALKHPWFNRNKSKELLNQITDASIHSEFIYNLKAYKSDSILQEAALAYLVHNYPQLETIQNANKLFNQMDTSGSGKITQSELYKGLAKTIRNNTLKDDVAIIFKNIDSDDNGYIEYEEFVRAAINKQVFLKENILRFAFNFFDKDNSGEISYEEIKEIFKDNAKGDVNACLDQIIKEVDTNGNGIIEYEEFKEIMQKLLKKKY